MEDGMRRHGNSKTWRNGKWIAGSYLFILPFMAFFSTFTLGPIFTAVYMSFRKWPILAKKHPFVGFANYAALLSDGIWWQALRNTLYFAFLTAFATAAFAFMVAIGINKPIRGRNVFRFLFYTPVVLSVAAMGIIMGWAFNTQFGIVNAAIRLFGLEGPNWLGEKNLVIPTLSIASVWWGFGAPMLIFLAGLQSLPRQIYEAAAIDGAGPGQRLFKITVPLMFPTIFFVLVTQLIAHLQVFGQSYLITSGGPGRESYTSIYYLYQTAWRYYKMGYGATIAIGLAIVILLITLAQFKLSAKYNAVEY
jgi:multiple sugar transport system permease protein